LSAGTELSPAAFFPVVVPGVPSLAPPTLEHPATADNSTASAAHRNNELMNFTSGFF
jgi:hypothetical protein